MSGDLASPRNARVKLVRRLARDATERRRSRLCLVEGPRVVADYLATGSPIEDALVSPRLEALPGGGELLRALEERLAEGGRDVLRIGDDALASAAAARSTQGVALVVPRPLNADLPAATADGILVAWEVGDPRNAGALARTAEAGGAAALVLARSAPGQSVDPYAPEAVRASAGSCFRLAMVERVGDPVELVAGLRAAGYRAACCVPRGGRAPEDVNLAVPTALVVGSETRGLPAELSDAADELLTIPIRSAVSSLNVAAAAAVVVFETARQRRLASPRGPC